MGWMTLVRNPTLFDRFHCSHSFVRNITNSISIPSLFIYVCFVFGMFVCVCDDIFRICPRLLVWDIIFHLTQWPVRVFIPAFNHMWHTRLCVSTCPRVYISVYFHARTYVHTYPYVLQFMHVYVCVVCMDLCPSPHPHVSIYNCMYFIVCIRTCKCVFVYFLNSVHLCMWLCMFLSALTRPYMCIHLCS